MIAYDILHKVWAESDIDLPLVLGGGRDLDWASLISGAHEFGLNAGCDCGAEPPCDYHWGASEGDDYVDGSSGGGNAAEAERAAREWLSAVQEEEEEEEEMVDARMTLGKGQEK